MKSKIIVDFRIKKELMKRLQTSYPTVRAALNGSDDTKLKRNIRFVALQDFGGVEVNNKK